jgi:hypothetical protein
MFKIKSLMTSILILGFFSIFTITSANAQAAKKRRIERKSLKFNISELAIADIPISSRMGVSYEFLLDKNYGIMIGMAYLGYPISMLGGDSLSRAWRATVLQRGFNFDLSFRHYFDDADESSLYISTFFSTSRLWVDSNGAPSILTLKKDRVAIMIGQQKKWRSLYFDMSIGLGVKSQNWRTRLQQTPIIVGSNLRPDYNPTIGWNLDFSKPIVALAVPIQLLVGIRF